jgi:hypothetical protein
MGGRVKRYRNSSSRPILLFLGIGGHLGIEMSNTVVGSPSDEGTFENCSIKPSLDVNEDV